MGLRWQKPLVLLEIYRFFWKKHEVDLAVLAKNDQIVTLAIKNGSFDGLGVVCSFRFSGDSISR